MDDFIGRTGWRDIVPQRQFEADEILKYRGEPMTPAFELEIPQIHTIDFNSTALRIVQPAQQLRQGGFTGTILPDNGQG